MGARIRYWRLEPKLGLHFSGLRGARSTYAHVGKIYCRSRNFEKAPGGNCLDMYWKPLLLPRTGDGTVSSPVLTPFNIFRFAVWRVPFATFGQFRAIEWAPFERFSAVFIPRVHAARYSTACATHRNMNYRKLETWNRLSVWSVVDLSGQIDSWSVWSVLSSSCCPVEVV